MGTAKKKKSQEHLSPGGAIVCSLSAQIANAVRWGRPEAEVQALIEQRDEMRARLGIIRIIENAPPLTDESKHAIIGALYAPRVDSGVGVSA